MSQQFVTDNYGNIVPTASDNSGDNSLFGTMQLIKRSLSSAEILSLFTSPITLIPAAGPNTLIIPLQSVLITTFGTAPYTYSGGGNIDLFWNNNVLCGLLSVNAWEQSANNMNNSGGSFNTVGNPALAINEPVTLFAQAANLTGGDGTAKLWVYYIVLDLS